MSSTITLRAISTSALANGTLHSNYTRPVRFIIGNANADHGYNSNNPHMVRNIFIYIIIAIAIFILAAAIGLTRRRMRRGRAAPSKV